MSERICTKCILNDKYPNIKFQENGECSLCSNNKHFTPLGEEKLIHIFNNIKSKNKQYDVLVPISGGKDSAYILHLAVNIYKLKVLTMTYDNGLLSPLALENINRITKKTGVKHVFYKADTEIQKKIYHDMLLYSGDMCGACDIATKASIIKVARKHKISTVLYGTSPLEEDSFVPDSIQDISRFKYILKQSKILKKKEIKEFLIYPHLNLFSISINKKTGIFPKEIRPLFYIKNPSDNEMGEIIEKELNWKANKDKTYTKHFDCIAEPLSNYIRQEIYGYERRLCQYSNMIRRNEINREQALELYKNDNIDKLPDNTNEVLNYLNINKNELEKLIKNNKPLQYENHISKLNKVFSILMEIKKRK
jgi:hypothetical protein